MPEVTLLKIDQIANKPMPIMANTDENMSAKSLNFAPKTKASIRIAIKKV